MKIDIKINRTFKNGDRIIFVNIYDDNGDHFASFPEMKYIAEKNKVFDHRRQYVDKDGNVGYTNSYISPKIAKDAVLKFILSNA